MKTIIDPYNTDLLEQYRNKMKHEQRRRESQSQNV